MTRTRANIMLIKPKPGEQRALRYDPEYCWVIRDMAQQGKFPESWCAHIGVTMSTLYNWADEYPEFSEAFEIAWHLLNDYWTEYAVKNLSNIDLRSTVLLEILRKRFPETWGRQARNTLGNFQTRNSPEAGEAGAPPAMAPPTGGTEADILSRLEALKKRRAMEDGGND